MSLPDEIARLQQLRETGALTDAEFVAAKQRLIHDSEGADGDSPLRGLGEAANRYVSLQMVMSVVGVIVFLIFLFGVFLPMSCKVGRGFDSSPTMPSLPSGLHQ